MKSGGGEGLDWRVEDRMVWVRLIRVRSVHPCPRAVQTAPLCSRATTRCQVTLQTVKRTAARSKVPTDPRRACTLLRKSCLPASRVCVTPAFRQRVRVSFARP